jgi:large conductance mechanosensitive channel
MESEIKLTKDDIEKIKEKAKEEAKEEFENFSKFAFKGSMIQMSVAFILGAAFKNVVTSISENLIMPIINFLLNKTGTDWRSLSWTPIDGMIFEFGKFMGSFIDFLIIAIILYIIWKKIFKGKEEEEI